MTPLPAKRRSELRAEAHKLTPVVIIGDKGLTDEVLAEIDRSLKAHELIKVRAAAGEREAREAWLEAICTKLEAHPVQQIGKIFVVFRKNPDVREPQVGRQKNDARGAERQEDRPGPRAGIVTERGKLRQRSRDQEKQRELDLKDMARKGKIKLKAETGAAAGRRKDDAPPEESSTPASRPRSRMPSAPEESGARRRRPRNSR